MITLFISFHYACLFISKHLRLVALFACALWLHAPFTETALVAPSSAAWAAAAAHKNIILIIFAQFCHKQLAKLAKFS